MTNEELALRIKAGDKAAVEQLWLQIRRLLCLYVNQFYSGQAGVARDDLEQESFFAMLDAVAAWEPDCGCKLTTYLRYPIQNRFNALIGVRGKGDPLDKACSLDEPTTEDLTIADSIPDPAATEAYVEVEDRTYISALRQALESAIDTLPPREQALIRDKHFRGRKLKDIAGDIGLSYSRCAALEHKAMRGLRRPQAVKHLDTYREDIITTHAYRGGLTSFRHSHTSSTELAVLKLQERHRQTMEAIWNE